MAWGRIPNDFSMLKCFFLCCFQVVFKNYCCRGINLHTNHGKNHASGVSSHANNWALLCLTADYCDHFHAVLQFSFAEFFFNRYLLLLFGFHPFLDFSAQPNELNRNNMYAKALQFLLYLSCCCVKSSINFCTSTSETACGIRGGFIPVRQ